MRAEIAADRVFTIYRVTCAPTGKSYIGLTVRSVRVRWSGHLEAVRSGSATPLHRAIRKYGSDAFAVEAIAMGIGWDDGCALEVALIAQERSLSPSGFNVTAGGDGTIGWERPKSWRLKVSAALTDLPKSEEHKAKLSEAMKRQATPEFRRALSARQKQVYADPELRAKVSVAKIAVMTDEYRAKLSKAAKGRRLTDEQKLKLSLYRTGEKLSEETKQKMSAAHQKRIAAMPPKEPKPKTTLARGEKLRGRRRPAEVVAKIAAANRASMTDERRKLRDDRMRSYSTDPVLREKRSAARRAAVTDAFRQKMSAIRRARLASQVTEGIT